MKKNQAIVVTGAAGFIGSCFVRYLNDQGHTNIVLVDTLGTDDRWKNLVGKTFVEILSPASLLEWLSEDGEDVSTVVHLGACSNTVEKDADFLLQNNTKYTDGLAMLCVEKNIRLIYASSAATYGNGEKGFSDDPEMLASLQPLNMYGYSKHLSDLSFYKHGLLNDVVGLKFFNVFGPNEWHKGRMASSILHFTNQIKETGSVKLFKSSEPNRFPHGGQMRDFIYVKDVVKVLYDLMKSSVAGLYNLGTGTPETWNSLATNVFSALSIKPNIEYVDMPLDLVGKYQNYTSADMERLQKAMKKKIRFTPFREAIHDYVSNHLVPGVYY